VPERFSAEWIEVLDAAARTLPGAASSFTIQQVITGEDEVAWHVVLGVDGVRVHPGLADAPDVTFTQDRTTADAIASGQLGAATALTSGRLTVRGATARLTDHRELLAQLDEALPDA
jgi:hypothetical protein